MQRYVGSVCECVWSVAIAGRVGAAFCGASDAELYFGTISCSLGFFCPFRARDCRMCHAFIQNSDHLG